MYYSVSRNSFVCRLSLYIVVFLEIGLFEIILDIVNILGWFGVVLMVDVVIVEFVIWVIVVEVVEIFVLWNI